jgi:anti-sigma factor RsiW
MSDPNNISPFGKGKERLTEDKLLAYMEGKLSAEEQHEVEQWLAEEGMESDAVEGLKAMRPDAARHTVNKLNHNLRKTLLSRKRPRRALKHDQFSWIAIVIILLLVVVAYLVIRKSM